MKATFSRTRHLLALAAGLLAIRPAAPATVATAPAQERTIRILDHTGDTVLTVKPDDAAAKAEAEALFARLKATGASAFTFPESASKGEGRRISSLDEAQAETIIIPRIVAG